MGDESRVLFISGGGGPSGNHYSQYLQAVRLSAYLHDLPRVASIELFGSGLMPENASTRPPDVVKEDVDGVMTRISPQGCARDLWFYRDHGGHDGRGLHVVRHGRAV